MKLNNIYSFLLILLMGQSALANITRPGEQGQPTKVYVSIYILDLDAIDTAEQSFIANVYFVYRWHDPSHIHDGSGTTIHPLSEIWHPRIQIANQQKVFPTFPEEVTISPNGEVQYLQRVWGSFSQPLQLKNFPFDQQVFNIQLIAVRYTEGEVQLIPDPQKASGIADQVSVTDWKITGWKIGNKPFQPGADHIPVSAFELSVSAERRIDYFIVNVIAPLFLIVAMSWVVFWIEPKGSSGTKISVSVTSMLTLIAYRFAIGASVPKLSYLTRLDEFILWSTVLIFATLLQTVFTSSFANSGRFDLAFTIDKWSRWLFPSVFVLVVCVTLGVGL